MEYNNTINEENFQRFSNIISTKTMQGYMVADRNDKALIAVLVKPGAKVNHLLHLIISFLTCGFWLIIWGYLALFKAKEQRVRVSIDSAGNVIEENIKIQMIPCLIKSYTGHSCPGCGIQRSLYSLLELDFVASFYYYPPLFIGTLISLLFLVVKTVLLPSLNFKHLLYLNLIVILLNFIINDAA